MIVGVRGYIGGDMLEGTSQGGQRIIAGGGCVGGYDR